MNFTVKILGTASALPTTQRFPSSQVVDVRGRLFMIDCGEGAQIQLRKAKVSFVNIEHICLSHIMTLFLQLFAKSLECLEHRL